MVKRFAKVTSMGQKRESLDIRPKPFHHGTLCSQDGTILAINYVDAVFKPSQNRSKVERFRPRSSQIGMAEAVDAGRSFYKVDGGRTFVDSSS